jgi:spore germination protein YaaH
MRGILTLLIIATPLAAPAAPAQMAYYEGSASLTSLQAEHAVLNIAAADLFAINAQGEITGKIPANVAALASTNHIALYAVVSNYAGSGFKAKIATAILTPGAAQDAAVANMVKIASTTAGINLDFEAVPHKERPLYTAFAHRLATALHAAGGKLILSVPAKTADLPNDSWAGAYDYAALAGIADTLQVMTYDENGPWGAPGPVSGLDWMTACLTYAQSVIPLPQISLGVPAYGYDWNLTAGTGTSVNWNQIPALLSKTGATPQWDATSSSPWFSYTASNGASHVVWYENARSIQLKAGLAASNQIANISVWALGLEDPSFWAAVAAGFAAN